MMSKLIYCKPWKVYTTPRTHFVQRYFDHIEQLGVYYFFYSLQKSKAEDFNFIEATSEHERCFFSITVFDIMFQR